MPSEIRWIREGVLYSILIFLSFPSISQEQQKVDSLLALLPAKSDSLTCVIYGTLWSEYRYIDFDRAKTYAFKELEYAEKSKLAGLIVDAKLNLGNHYGTMGKVDSADLYYDKAIADLNEEGDERKIARILLNSAYTHCGRGYYDEGMKRFQRALDQIDQKWPDDPLVGECLLSLGMVHGAIKNYDMSDDYLNQAKELFQRINNDDLFYETVMMIGVNQLETYDYEAARMNFVQSVNFYREIEDPFKLVKGYSNLGAVLQHMDSLDRAEFYFEEGLKLAIDEHYEHMMMVMYQRLGEINLDKKDFNKAIDYTNKSNALSIKVEDIRGQAKDNQILSSSHEELGNYKLALGHMKEYLELQDSILSMEKIAQMNELEQKYQTEKKEQEILLLKEKEKRNSLEKRGMIGGIAGLICLFCVFIYAMRQRMKKNKLAKEKVDQELEFSTKELAFSQKELDIKKQELTAYALQLAHNNEVLEEIKSKVSEAQAEKDNKRSLQKVINKIDFNQNDSETWDGFRQRFQAVHKDFESSVKHSFPEVSKNEMRLMALLKMNLTSKEIANILNISGEGIKKARYRLRKKLGLETGSSLEEFVISL